MRQGLDTTFTAQERDGDPGKTMWRGKCLEPSCHMQFTFDELQLLQVSSVDIILVAASALTPSHARAHEVGMVWFLTCF